MVEKIIEWTYAQHNNNNLNSLVIRVNLVVLNTNVDRYI